jgi:hypothetical protein
MPSIPALPLLALTCLIASFPCIAGSDSNSRCRGSWASPEPAGIESPSRWVFCRLSLLRSMFYLPLVLVRAFAPRFRFGLSVAPPFGLECLTSLTDVRSTMPSADFWPPCQISRGKFSRLPRTIAGSTLRVLDGYGLRGNASARPTLTPPIRFLFIDPRFCSTLPPDPHHAVALAFR